MVPAVCQHGVEGEEGEGCKESMDMYKFCTYSLSELWLSSPCCVMLEHTDKSSFMQSM